jgi:hypothetical protein
VSTGKKFFVPIFFISGSFLHCLSVILSGSFESFISSVDSGVVPIGAIRSVTHLVLAPAQENFSFLSLKSFPFPAVVFWTLPGRAQPASAGPENIQFRSVFIQLKDLWFARSGLSGGPRPTRF